MCWRIGESRGWRSATCEYRSADGTGNGPSIRSRRNWFRAWLIASRVVADVLRQGHRIAGSPAAAIPVKCRPTHNLRRSRSSASASCATHHAPDQSESRLAAIGVSGGLARSANGTFNSTGGRLAHGKAECRQRGVDLGAAPTSPAAVSRPADHSSTRRRPALNDRVASSISCHALSGNGASSIWIVHWFSLWVMWSVCGDQRK